MKIGIYIGLYGRMKKQNYISLLFLLAISIVSAMLWWLEVQNSGWDGLTWIGYFHMAIPVGVVFFLAWLYFNSGILSVKTRFAYVGIIGFYSIIVYYVLDWSLRCHYSQGRYIWMPFGDWPFFEKFALYSIYLIFPALPIIFFAISRLFGIRLKYIGLLAGFIIYSLSIPAAIFLIDIVNHRGTPDSIHAIKTGFCIPFLMFGLGLPFVLDKKFGSNIAG